MNIETLISEGLATLGLTTSAETCRSMVKYSAELLAQNKVMNLTTITEPDQVARLHFLDSAALLGCTTLAGKSLIDVGTGAGFPGLVLKLLEPSLSLTLLDSLDKRLSWLGGVCDRLDLNDVKRVHARAEEQSRLSGFRDSFDFATARAVADLRLLSELCLPYVKIGGRFLAMKAAGCEEEVTSAADGIARLGGALRPTYTYIVPGTEVTRKVIIIEKIAPTPAEYPRRWAAMKKTPL